MSTTQSFYRPNTGLPTGGGLPKGGGGLPVSQQNAMKYKTHKSKAKKMMENFSESNQKDDSLSTNVAPSSSVANSPRSLVSPSSEEVKADK